MILSKEEIIRKIKTNIHEIDPAAEIWLFGSRARNEEHTESDWDVLVLSKNSNIAHSDESRYLDNMANLIVETGQVIQLQVYSFNEWHNKYNIIPLYKSIKDEGVRI